MATLMQKFTNPLEMLVSDHNYVKGIFKQCLTTDSVITQRILIQELADNLLIHAALEEEVFYPALERLGGDEGRGFVEQARREHGGIKHRLKELQQACVEDRNFRMRLEALEDAVGKHAEREEQIFPLAERHLPLDRLAKEMDIRRVQLMARVRPPTALAVLGVALLGVMLFAFFTQRR